MIELLDTTLREGEQSPSVNFTIEEKIQIATLLDTFHIDFIEAGHPQVSKDIFTAVKKIAHQGYRAQILAHCRSCREDIDQARACDVDWVGLFFCVSEDRLRTHFKTDINTVESKIVDAICYAKEHGLKVRYTPEDAVRTRFSSLLRIIHAAVNAGVDRISIADTVGAMTPLRMHHFIQRLRRDVSVPLHVHCHNDLGMATANALAAYEAGVHTIDVTVNGLGERVGITPLAELCLALRFLYQLDMPWDLKLLPLLSEKVAAFSGVAVSENTPVIGNNAFVHSAGLHVNVVAQDPRFYEVVPAEVMGRKRGFTVNKMAGTATIRQKLNDLKINASEQQIEHVLKVVKQRSKGCFSDQEIRRLVSKRDYPDIGYQ